MSHDPDLARTTDSVGLIRERNWFGEDGMEHVRTIKEPKQPMPTFAEVIALLMLPENRHIKFNVGPLHTAVSPVFHFFLWHKQVDVKVQNDPNRLFKLIHETISAQENWETTLAPRTVLGLWHPTFIIPAKTHLPYLTLSHIGVSLEIAREYFWDSCDVFSMLFVSLASIEGERFR
jgi:phosphatidylglycerol phospholipase C